MGHFKLTKETTVLAICQKPLELTARGCSASTLDHVTFVMKTIRICEAGLLEVAVMKSNGPVTCSVEQEMSTSVQSDSKF